MEGATGASGDRSAEDRADGEAGEGKGRGLIPALIDHVDADLVQLSAGDVLCAKGERLDVIYQVRSGSLAVIGDRGEQLAVLSSPALIGDISAVAGGTTTAEVRAHEPSELAAIPLATFEAWLAANPVAAADITSIARERANRTRAAAVIADIAGPDIDPTAIVDRLETMSLAAGAELFAQGDDSDAAYIVLTGRLQVEQLDDSGVVMTDVEVGRGALVGELGIIDDDVRSASIRAVRTATLARLGREDFEQLAAAHPALTLRIVRSLLDRMRNPSRSVAKVRAIAVVVTDPSADQSVISSILDEVRQFGSADFVDPDVADAMLGRSGLARARSGTLAHDRLSDQLHEIEANSDYLLLGASPDDPTAAAEEPAVPAAAAADDPWERRIIERSDRLIIVSSSTPGPAERAAIDRMSAIAASSVGTSVWLARRYPSGVQPSGAARWLAHEGIDEVHQVRAGDDRDLRRLARLATGNGTGLVLSGGGGRGFAHLGVIRSLEEQGIEIDAIAGTSIGAVMGTLVAIDTPAHERVPMVSKGFHDLFDYTLPVVALLRSERITRKIYDILGDRQIEDCWVPIAIVTTSLTTSSPKVHRTGPMATAVRASVSLPAVLPPVTYDGELLVDGGVVDNLPVDALAGDERVGTLIAVDLAPPPPPSSRSDFAPAVSGLQAVRARVDPRASNFPTIGSTLIRSLLVSAGARRAQVLASGAIDLTIVLDLDGVGLLDFERVPEIAELGYRDAHPQITEWVRDRSAGADDRGRDTSG